VPPEVTAALYGHVGPPAIDHVFRVAAALDSLVLGEAQILGQLKEAFGRASAEGTAGPVLGRCLERAWSAAKRVRTETAIAKRRGQRVVGGRRARGPRVRRPARQAGAGDRRRQDVDARGAAPARRRGVAPGGDQPLARARGGAGRRAGRGGAAVGRAAPSC
jgi:hypothetical protein